MTGVISKNKLTINEKSPLILASASPRRKELLQQVKIPFITSPCNIDEEIVNGTPYHIACTLAEKKALYASSRFNDNWILGADTIVVSEGKILGKPSDGKDAVSMLQFLSNREHEVITGLSITCPIMETCHTEYVSSSVEIKKLSEREITAYVNTGEPFGKAGSYAIQGIGSFMIKRITGSYSNVVGLPLYTLINTLLNLGAMEIFPME